MITTAQLALIHVAKKRLGLDDDSYRAVLKNHGGVESAKDLDAAGFEAVMHHCSNCGFKSPWKKKNYGDRPGMASPRQVQFIRDLWREYTGGDDEAGLNRWLERTCKLSALAFLTPPAAQAAITGLKKMTQRGAAKPAHDGAA
jgi:hypothetical protein